ncbi:MAG: AraC family transcriptional regulator [Dysgonamonadaceae bacterium]|jgi:AraC-like DNA-binding protein|nr:AraC family transcriptional regulator [Dysgonamonadaceae bacterium]
MKTVQEKSFSANSFPIVGHRNMWECLDFPGNRGLKRKTSSEAIIFFVTEGCISLSINDLGNHIIHRQEMFLIPDNCSYAIKVSKPANLISCSFGVETLLSEQKMIDELIPLYNDDRSDLVKLPINNVINDCLFLLKQCMRDGLTSHYFFDLKKRELFLLLFTYYTKKDLARFLCNILSENVQFRGFVMDNFLNARNIQELADMANYSTSGFIKKFQRNFKESPYKWIQRQKAKLILSEINEDAKSLQEIASEYKFSSYQHFANFCKIHFGSPPTGLINKYKSMDSK